MQRSNDILRFQPLDIFPKDYKKFVLVVVVEGFISLVETFRFSSNERQTLWFTRTEKL